ncbi:MAG: ATP-binding protein [Phenylobacterium sp.]|uniref:hybrid sensor histidine kinase/response regulator n=1 Tax=Phenylobacterium sp. TaxID=1871053 RepID=UPI002727E6DA|nr:ATP-binding protein [Phenylobacterium sp.]MDO8410016.1 ATP-binding protein [Phenylobacterium sp.]
MALAVIAAVLVFVACGGLLYYASVTVDRITEARETRLMERVIGRRLARLHHEVSSVTVWSEAYDKTAKTYDPEWAHINYGAYYSDYLQHDATIVFDAQDRLIYASQAGEVEQLSKMTAFADAVRPLVREARAQAEQKIAASPNAVAFHRVGAAEAAVRVGNRFYLAGASTVVPDPDYERPLIGGNEPVVVSAVELDGALMKALGVDYGLRGARILAADGRANPAVALLGADKAPLAVLNWKPERPGIKVLSRAKWPILGVGLVVLVIVGLVIWRLQRLARQLVRARERAEAGERVKAEFIANMSHEIRTPLNGILGMAQVMEAGDLCDEQRRRLKVVRDSGATLLGVLNDVLDLAKIEAGKLQLEETAFVVEDLGRRVCDTFAELAASKDLELSLVVEPGVAPAWTGDPLRIRQILGNLISNAIKFTDKGAVTLRVRAHLGGLSFLVTDSGIGLGESQLPALFDKFSQGDASTTRRYGGTGLGLSICRDLVALMGGTIIVESRLGEGSIFIVNLPLKPAESTPGPGAEARPVAATDPDKPLRILAAEDNPTNQVVLRALISPLGAELAIVADGREAVDAFAGGAVDLVLMDIQMPEMNGLEAAKAIRAIEREHGLARTPILALTANVMTHQLETYTDAGMDGHVAKPVDARALYAAMEAALGSAVEQEDVA